MDSKEARRVLHAYREDLDPDSHPALAEALDLAASDAELEAFLKEEKAFDNVFVEKLNETPVPPGLLERILESKSGGGPEPAELIPDSRRESRLAWWQQPVTWSMAACLLALLSIGVFLVRQPEVGPEGGSDYSIEQFVQAVVDHSVRVEKMEYLNHDAGALYRFLVQRNAPYPRAMPDRMKNLESVGCLSFAWHDRQIGVICLKGEKMYNLYVAERSEFPNLKDYRRPNLHQIKNHGAAAWTSEKQIFVLTVEGNTEDLGPLL